MIGGGCPDSVSLNSQQVVFTDSTRYQELAMQFQMDHSCMPLTRICSIWYSASAGHKWDSGVHAPLLLHLLFGVSPAEIPLPSGNLQMPLAVAPRCISCHNTWQENHGALAIHGLALAKGLTGASPPPAPPPPPPPRPPHGVFGRAGRGRGRGQGRLRVTGGRHQ